jgi:hypothetical protein
MGAKMIPTHCRVKHNPEAGQYGDCLRACIAALFEADPQTVPHFFHDGCDGETGHERLRDWCASQGFHPIMSQYDGSASFEMLGNVIRAMSPNVYYLLFAQIEAGDHVVIGLNGETVWNPSWYPTPIIGPNGNGNWGVMHFVSDRFAKA